MRTTLSLDPDVASLVEQELSQKKTTLKAVINEKLRRGFALDAAAEQPKFELPPAMDLGKPLIHNFDNIAEVLELMER